MRTVYVVVTSIYKDKHCEKSIARECSYFSKLSDAWKSGEDFAKTAPKHSRIVIRVYERTQKRWTVIGTRYR